MAEMTSTASTPRSGPRNRCRDPWKIPRLPSSCSPAWSTYAPISQGRSVTSAPESRG